MKEYQFNRKSIRLKGYDYSKSGLYFITICCYQHKRMFGNIINEKMELNEMGKIAQQCWLEIPQHFKNVVLHEFVIMPNHVHGIIEFAGANQYSPNKINNPDNTPNKSSDNSLNVVQSSANGNSPLRSPSKTIGSVVRGFKIGVTKWVRQNTSIINVWQRNYHDIIIRDQKSYQNITYYILNNPVKWVNDKFYS